MGGHYSGNVTCFIKSDNDYKVDEISILLDGQPFAFATKRVRAKKFEIPFNMETEQFENGRHVLEIEAADSSYHRNKSKDKWNFNVDNKPLKSSLLDSEFKIDQGRTLHVKFQANKEIEKARAKFLGEFYNFYPESKNSNLYECFIPLECEDNEGEHLLEAEILDHVKNCVKLAANVKINKYDFPRQKGFSVAKEKLDDEKEVSMNSKILWDALDKWLKDSPKEKLWTGPFELPTVVQWIATPYGEIRTTPERGRYLHKAVDIANMPGGVVWASQNGKVIIKDRFLMSGNTVVLDHGMGVFSHYYHLNDFADIEVGDIVKKGNPIGKIGMTGYATGPHLHWGLYVNNIAVDPLQWTKKTFF
ncbi:MAG: M23 family metallopeptidase [bacterium]